MTERKCLNCGFINTGSAVFCGNCGRSLAESPVEDVSSRPAGLCPRCGAENPTGATFCGSCGLSLADEYQPPNADNRPPPIEDRPAAPASRPAGRYLLPLILLAGLIFLGAAAAFFLLSRPGDERPSMAVDSASGEPTDNLPSATGEDATSGPTDVPPSRAAGDLASYELYRNDSTGDFGFWLTPQNGQPAFFATTDGREYSAGEINAGPPDEAGIPESIPGWTRMSNPEIVTSAPALSDLTFGDPTSGFRISGQMHVAVNVRMPTKEPSGGDGEETITVAEVSPTIATATLVPTVTPFPTGTPRPTLTPFPTATPQPATSLPSPTSIPLPTALPTSPPPVVCQQSPGDRWGPTLWDRYQANLGCATTGEIRSNAAYQYYQHGMMVWREVPDLVYVLYNNGTFDVFPAAGPDGYFHSDWLKGSFGYLWNNNAAVRERVGQPQAAEFNATDFAAQDFAGGTIFYFFENDARNYALFDSSGTWVSAQE